jgi:hypothetical protein
MRKLKTQDIFRLSAIVRKLNLKKELQTLATEGMSAEQYGIQLFLLLFENMDQAEEEICSFFADIAEMSVEDFRAMDLGQLGQFIAELREEKGLSDFFQLAFKTATQN